MLNRKRHSGPIHAVRSPPAGASSRTRSLLADAHRLHPLWCCSRVASRADAACVRTGTACVLALVLLALVLMLLALVRLALVLLALLVLALVSLARALSTLR